MDFIFFICYRHILKIYFCVSLTSSKRVHHKMAPYHLKIVTHKLHECKQTSKHTHTQYKHTYTHAHPHKHTQWTRIWAQTRPWTCTPTYTHAQTCIYFYEDGFPIYTDSYTFLSSYTRDKQSIWRPECVENDLLPTPPHPPIPTTARTST